MDLLADAVYCSVLILCSATQVDPDDEMEVSTVMAFRGRNVSRWAGGLLRHKITPASPQS